MSMSLQEIRGALDEVDQRIVKALANRHELVTLVLKAKQEPITGFDRDEIREHEILARVERQARKVGIDPNYVASLFREIIQHSVDWQRQNTSEKNDRTRACLYVSDTKVGLELIAIWPHRSISATS